MKIIEMYLIDEICERAKLKVVRSTQTLDGNSTWVLSGLNIDAPKLAFVKTDKHFMNLEFKHEGLSLTASVDFGLEIRNYDVGYHGITDEDIVKIEKLKNKLMSWIPTINDFSDSAES